MTMQAAGLVSAGPPPTPARPRLTYIDNLRMALITTIVLAHLSITYGADADWYYYEGGEPSLVPPPL